MGQILLGGTSAGGNVNAGTQLDAMFTELYALRSLVASISTTAVTWNSGHTFTNNYANLPSVTGVSLGAAGGTTPIMSMVNASGGTDAKMWDWYADGSGYLNFRCLNDAVGAANTWMEINRAGYVPQFVAFGCNVVPITDNTRALGSSGNRWSVVYAGTGTINTSDGDTKQDIAPLTAAEHATAVALKGLVRRFRFKDAVAAKGAAARVHIGVIAQDVQAAFAAQGLDAAAYGLFCSDTWEDKAGVSHTRLGVRYDELLAFVVAAL